MTVSSGARQARPTRPSSRENARLRQRKNEKRAQRLSQEGSGTHKARAVRLGPMGCGTTRHLLIGTVLTCSSVVLEDLGNQRACMQDRAPHVSSVSLPDRTIVQVDTSHKSVCVCSLEM